MTYDFVADKLAANGFRPTIFTCADGAKIEVRPCYYGDQATKVEDCDYFLIEDGILPWLGGDKVTDIVKVLNNHAELVAENEDDKAKLRAYFDEHERKGWDAYTWDFYSDWHKDVYGYRPHGRVCGVYVSPY